MRSAKTIFGRSAAAKTISVFEEDILEAAMRLAFDVGLHAVTPAAVAERAGTSIAAVLGIEPDFDALVAEVFRRIVAAELAEVKRVALVHPDAHDQLDALVTLLAEPVHVEVTAAWVESFSLGRTNAPLAAAVVTESDSWQRFVSSVLQRGVRDGAWTTDRPDALAAHVIAMIDGINAYALVGYDTGVERRRMLEAILEHGLSISLSGHAASSRP